MPDNSAQKIVSFSCLNRTTLKESAENLPLRLTPNSLPYEFKFANPIDPPLYHCPIPGPVPIGVQPRNASVSVTYTVGGFGKLVGQRDQPQTFRDKLDCVPAIIKLVWMPGQGMQSRTVRAPIFIRPVTCSKPSRPPGAHTMYASTLTRWDSPCGSESSWML
jgi:hypothetical protein